ncbi:hypothetical protein [Anaerobaca lacustris]|uniref:Uncharacterized protein n=1 Tax=Anaerobaca lacustris TaxID=3044600 RepID=A0AAW6TRS8_9BACT|nr:hypothetical protein [Sedimentisphaerales bacterium M17dextr]
MTSPKPAGRPRRSAAPAGNVVRRWSYWRLMSGVHCVGFMRTAGDDRQFVDMKSDTWRREPIAFDESVRLAEPLPGFSYLKEPDE